MKKKGKRGRAAVLDATASIVEKAAPPVNRLQSVLLAGMTALVVARTLVPEDPGGQSGYGAPFNVLWLVLACAWLLGRLRQGDVRLRFGWADGLMLAFVAWNALSALVAFHAGNPRAATNMLWEWVGLGAAFFLARQLIGTAREARAVIVVMLGLACGLSATAVHQYFVTIPADVRAYEAAKDSTETLYEQTGQWLPAGSAVRQQFENRLNSRLPGATFALSNSLAGFLAPWFVMLFGITIGSRGRATVLIGVAAMALLAVGMFLTRSRSGSLAVVVGMVLVAADVARGIHWPRSILRAAAVVLVVVLVAAFAIGFGTSGGRTALAAAERSLEFRFGYWRATLAMIRDYPLFGVGPGQFQDYYATYKLPAASEVVQDPHNWLLEVWATAGTPAAIFLLGLLGVVSVRAWRSGGEAVVENGRHQSTASYSALLGGLAGVAVGAAIAWLSGFSVAQIHVLLVVAGILSTAWLWRGWTSEGVLSWWLPMIAAIALLVNLLAAGGINYPSVAGSLMLLLAIGLNFTDRAGNKTVERLLQSTFGRWGACAALAAALAAAIWSEYQPVMGCRLQLSMADAALVAGRADQLRTALEAAVAADPWSPEAAQRLAAQRFADYQALPTPTQRRSLLEADEAARRLAPHRSSTWAQSADFAAAIHEHTSGVEDLDAAQRYYERAMELFPSNAELRLQAAKFWQTSGKQDRARQSAAEAIRLDDLMRAGGDTGRLLDAGQRQEVEVMAKQAN